MPLGSDGESGLRCDLWDAVRRWPGNGSAEQFLEQWPRDSEQVTEPDDRQPGRSTGGEVLASERVRRAPANSEHCTCLFDRQQVGRSFVDNCVAFRSHINSCLSKRDFVTRFTEVRECRRENRVGELRPWLPVQARSRLVQRTCSRRPGTWSVLGSSSATAAHRAQPCHTVPGRATSCGGKEGRRG